MIDNHYSRVAYQGEQVRFLYGHLPTTLFSYLFFAAIVLIVQSAIVSPVALFIWAAIFCAALVFRFGTLVAWKRAQVTRMQGPSRWLTLFRAGAIATGVAWGIGGVVLSQAAQVADITYLVFVTGGLSAAAMISLAIDRASSVGFVVPAVTPLLVFIALQGGELYLGMSAMMLLFLVFVVLTSTRIERTLHENYRLRTKAVEDEARFRSMLEHSPVATCMTDVETGKVLFANQSYARLMRLPLDSLLHAEPARLFADPDAYAALRSRLASGEEISDHLLEIAASGVQQWVLATFLRTQYHDKPANLMWFYDITDRKRSEEAVQHLAYHDTLTDLPNRILLNESLDRALLAAEREGTSLAVLFIDLDKFKPVNDAFGHAAGDALLQQVSQRLLDCVRKSDFIARVGGDEFVVLLHALQSIADATVTAEKIVEALQRPFVVDGRELHIAASIGVALYPQHAHNSGDLMQFADVAMYYAKLDDEAAVRVYTPGMASGAENISRNEREH